MTGKFYFFSLSNIAASFFGSLKSLSGDVNRSPSHLVDADNEFFNYFSNLPRDFLIQNLLKILKLKKKCEHES